MAAMKRIILEAIPQSYVKAAGEMGPRVKEAHNEEFEEYLRVERK